MKIYLLFLSFFFYLIVSCGKKNKINEKKIIEKSELCFPENKNYTGTVVMYYNNDSKIYVRYELENGIKNGSYNEYYKNSKLAYSLSYFNGFENGSVYFYDTLGNLTDIQNYYMGLRLGGQTHYSNSNVETYRFKSLCDEVLLYIDYKKLQSNPIVKICDELIFTKCSGDTIKDTVYYPEIFIYLPSPPKFKFNYSIIKYTKDLENARVLKELTDTVEWRRFFLYDIIERDYVIPKKDSIAIKLKIYDSTRNDSWTIVRKLF